MLSDIGTGVLALGRCVIWAIQPLTANICLDLATGTGVTTVPFNIAQAKRHVKLSSHPGVNIWNLAAADVGVHVVLNPGYHCPFRHVSGAPVSPQYLTRGNSFCQNNLK